MAKKKREETESINVRIPRALMERFRRALYWSAPRRTQVQVVRACIREIVERLEKEQNKGKTFPPIPPREE